MFFATAAGDRPAFAQLFNWTQNNLARGSLRERPAHRTAVGQDPDTVGAGQQLRVRRRYLDVVAAGPVVCGKKTRYTEVGTALLKRIAREEVVNVPGLGSMLLHSLKSALPRANSWRFNPKAICRRSWRNTLAVLARRGRRYGKPICGFCCGNRAERFLAPDWVRYESKQAGG